MPGFDTTKKRLNHSQVARFSTVFVLPFEGKTKSVFSCVFFLLSALCFFLYCSVSYAAQVTLTWDPPAISTDLTGYRIGYGISSGAYTYSIDVGNTTSHTVGNLLDGQTYYFAVVAYNSAGIESEYSNEVSKTMETSQSSLTILKTGKGTGVVSGSAINCGSICSALYQPDSELSLSATADAGSTFVGWSGGGCSGTGLCATTITGAVNVTATFNISIVTYVITASVTGTGGTISPSGTSSVNSGGSKTFTIVPNTGYSISDFIVDGQSVGPVTSYTFSNVSASHTIVATFTVESNVITACSGDVVVLQNMTFAAGNTYTCTATTSITAGTGVTVQSGATVNFRAPKINIRPGFRAESGAVFSAKQ